MTKAQGEINRLRELGRDPVVMTDAELLKQRNVGPATIRTMRRIMASDVDGLKNQNSELQNKLVSVENLVEEWRARALSEAALSRRLADAARALLNRHVSLVNSGDAGNWDPEEEKEVIALRSVLAESE